MSPVDSGGPAHDLGVAVLAAGAVLWRHGPDGGPEIALVHRPRYDDWTVPKGKLDHGESLPAAAVREVAEETGHLIRLGARLGEVRYPLAEGEKLVRYWSGESCGHDRFHPNHETDELRFLPPADAKQLMTYDRDRAILGTFLAIPQPTSVLLLVRHARAGSRSAWDGADEDRPLSGTGRAEVERLTPFLALFGPQRVHSAPSLRCRATVEPLAQQRGVPVVDEPLLAEAGYSRDRAGGLARLREIVAQPGVAVVCSQGGVIPDALGDLLAGTELAAQVGLPHESPPARKASTWVVGIRAGHPVFADYYRDTTG